MVDAPRDKLNRLVTNLHQVAEDDQYELDSSFNAKVKDYYRLDNETYSGLTGAIKRFFHRLAEGFHKGIFGSRDIVKVAARIDRFLSKAEVQSLLSQGNTEHLTQDDVNQLEQDIIKLRDRLYTASESNTYTKKVRDKASQVVGNLEATLVTSTLSKNSSNDSQALLNRAHLVVPPPANNEQEYAQDAAEEVRETDEQRAARIADEAKKVVTDTFGEPLEVKSYGHSVSLVQVNEDLAQILTTVPRVLKQLGYTEDSRRIFLHREQSVTEYGYEDVEFSQLSVSNRDRKRTFVQYSSLLQFFSDNILDLKQVFNDFVTGCHEQPDFESTLRAQSELAGISYPLDNMQDFFTQHAFNNSPIAKAFKDFILLSIDNAFFTIKIDQLTKEKEGVNKERRELIQGREDLFSALSAQIAPHQKEIEMRFEYERQLAPKVKDSEAFKADIESLNKQGTKEGEKKPLLHEQNIRELQEMKDALDEEISALQRKIDDIDKVHKPAKESLESQKAAYDARIAELNAHIDRLDRMTTQAQTLLAKAKDKKQELFRRI